MVSYGVYQMTFRTQRGTKRIYIGCTRALEVRAIFHQTDAKGWLGCQTRDEPDYKILEDNIPSLELALAAEALHAARAIAEEPKTSRGGPWSAPTLTQPMLQECRAVGLVRSFLALKAFADNEPEGRLSRHLADLSFYPAKDASRGAPTMRGAYVERKRKAGAPGVAGNVTRANQLAMRVYKRPSALHRRLHRGVDPQERRRRETERRPPRCRVNKSISNIC